MSFSAKRLSIARQRRGLTKKALAELLLLSAQSFTNYENGSITPSKETVLQIAAVLNFPLGFFYSTEAEELPHEAVSFRSRRSMTARVRDKTLATGYIAAQKISPELHLRFNLPSNTIPDLSGDSPEQAASQLREIWDLGQGPISNMVHLLESKGVEVYWQNEESPSVDAVSFWWDGKPYIVMSSHEEKYGDRGRLDAAHELAHLVLHRNVRDLSEQEVEIEAYRFGAAFLMPSNQFRAECPKLPVLSEFFTLKTRWGVSIQAMVRRCRDIGVFSEWQYESAFKSISSKGWRVKEPVPIPKENSRLHELIFESLSEKGIYPDRFAHDIDLGIDDLYELAPIASKYKRQTDKKEITLGHLRMIS